ncbi:hypothetical protein D3C74_497060 [compost metagenome]
MRLASKSVSRVASPARDFSLTTCSARAVARETNSRRVPSEPKSDSLEENLFLALESSSRSMLAP